MLRRLRYGVASAPVPWRDVAGSKVGAATPLAMAWDVARDEVPAWNVLGAGNILVAADGLYSAEAAASLPGVVAALPDLREIWLAHTHRGAGDRLDATIEALSATFPVAEVVERVRDTRVVVLRRQ